MTPTEIEDLAGYLTPTERAEFEALIAADVAEHPWRPLPGPQTMAYESEADVIGFGGAAGGGKTDLAVGDSITKRHEVMVMRREATQLQGVLSRLEELLGTRDGYNGQDKIWRNVGPRRVKIEFGSVPNLGDETKYQGRPHDFLVFDEAANFLEKQVVFLLGWNRSTRQGVRSQALLTFNPPTNAEGRWILDFFGPWIHPKWPAADRAQPGELRYVVTVPGDNDTFRYVWVEDATPCVIENGQLVYDFDPTDYKPEDIVTPQSRTFIPSRISDNPYLAQSGYLRVLQAMPEPLRSQMLYGDFQAGMTDDAFQVIPTEWVDRAMARWTDRSPKGEMTSMGVDVARGGKDNTTIARKHDNWFDRLIRLAGKATPDGHTIVAQIVANRRNSAPVHIDGIGVGASPVDLARGAHIQTISVNVSEKSLYRGHAGNLHFANLRSELWWRMREALDPQYDTGAMLPPDPDLAKELCAPKWRMQGKAIYVESREEIIERIGRSPDAATAVILAQIETPNEAKVTRQARERDAANYDPIAAHAERAPISPSRSYDPLANY